MQQSLARSVQIGSGSVDPSWTRPLPGAPANELHKRHSWETIVNNPLHFDYTSFPLQNGESLHKTWILTWVHTISLYH
jgi:hypothetical protein